MGASPLKGMLRRSRGCSKRVGDVKHRFSKNHLRPDPSGPSGGVRGSLYFTQDHTQQPGGTPFAWTFSGVRFRKQISIGSFSDRPFLCVPFVIPVYHIKKESVILPALHVRCKTYVFGSEVWKMDHNKFVGLSERRQGKQGGSFEILIILVSIEIIVRCFGEGRAHKQMDTRGASGPCSRGPAKIEETIPPTTVRGGDRKPFIHIVINGSRR